MQNRLFFLLLGAGLAAGVGCGDDTSTGGGGNGGGPNGGGPEGGGVEGGGGAGTGGDGGGVGAMGPGYSCDPAPADPETVTVTQVFSAGGGGLVQLKSAPGAPERMFAVIQNGFIRVIEDGTVLETPFLDVSDLIRGGQGSEEGLLGLAFHPDYATNGRFFIHYSQAGDGASTVMEYQVSADPLIADPTPVQLVLQTPTEQNNHNGGAVEFGNDGFLYIALGDGGGGGDPDCDALDTSSLLGKILRVDVDATPDDDGYPAAAGNPRGAKYYHIGLRNPWRISFDACTGDLYMGDVGQNAWEEIDHARASDGPLNFGWPVREGMHAFAGYNGACENDAGPFVEPVAEYAQQGGGSVTGGYVYRGSTSPSLRGWYFYADFVFGAFYMLKMENGTLVAGPTLLDHSPNFASTFGIDGNGEVYIGEYGGPVYRIEAD